MGDKFRWGIIGPGRIAQKFAQGLQVIAEARLQAVASTNGERAQAFADQYNAQKAYSSYEAMLNDPQVDAVYIATPLNFHYDNARICLEAGKPVLCEKPLTVNATQAQALCELARAKSIFLMEALWTRFHPAYQQVRRWLDDGAVGEIRLLDSTMGFNKPKDPQDRLFNPNLAGGALLDLGVYPIAISQWVMGKNPTAFQVKSHFSDTGVDDLTCATLQYGEGAFSQFSCNFLTDNQNEFIIYGTQGAIRIHPFYWLSTRVSLLTPDREETIQCPFRASGFEYEAEEVMRCVRDGKLESDIMPHAHTLANMSLMDDIRQEIGLVYPFEG
jgi:predicted dehydrogenase